MIDILVHFVPESCVIFTVTGSAKVVRIHKFMPFAFWGFFFNSLMNVNQLCYEAIVFLMVFISLQIAFFLTKLQGCMILICLDI